MVPGSPSFIQGFLHIAAFPGLLPAWKKAVCGATSTFILELIRRLPASLAGISETILQAIPPPMNRMQTTLRFVVTYRVSPSTDPGGTLPDWLGYSS